MPRVRTIKPEFWTDDKVMACSMHARLLFIGMWNFADDAGNLNRSASQIKARVLPVDRVDCEKLIVELTTHGLLIEYSVSDEKYLHIKGFEQHQVINRPSKPACPAYVHSMRTHGVLSEPSVSTHSGREGKGREGSTHESVGKDPPSPPRVKSVKTNPLPQDFTFTPELRAYAEKHLPDVDLPTLEETYIGLARSKGWKYTDWEMAVQTYVRQLSANSGHWSSGQYPRKSGLTNGHQSLAEQGWR